MGTVWVGGIPKEASEKYLSVYVQKGGNIAYAELAYDPETEMPRGFGFVQFEETAPVEKLKEEWSRHKILGRWVEVKRARPNRPKSAYATEDVQPATGDIATEASATEGVQPATRDTAYCAQKDDIGELAEASDDDEWEV